ncbi:MAG: hypothetical protein KDK39_05830 [Leptospiraceae bacterium]|nr:hypothetical protein [Leptospiraceae bacterium]
MIDDLMFTTAAGTEIKLRPGQDRCVVYFGNASESVVGPDGQQHMEQEVPYVAFVGAELVLDYPPGRVALVELSHGRLKIEYRIQSESRSRILNVQCNSHADQFPVRVRHFSDVRDFLLFVREEQGFRYVVAYEGVGRVGLVKIKAGNPEARILVIKQAIAKSNDAQPAVEAGVRATDVGLNAETARNPVFLARLHLRNLELDKVAGLLTRFNMSLDETGFIITFLRLMIKNEQGRPELEQVKRQLQMLEKLYQIGGLILSGDRDGFYAALKQGMPPAVYRRVSALVSQKRAAAPGKLEEIEYWEWQYRLKQALNA